VRRLQPAIARTRLTVFSGSTEVVFIRHRSVAGGGNRVAFERDVTSRGFNLHAYDVRLRRVRKP